MAAVDVIRLLTQRQIKTLEYLEQHPTIYAGTVSGVGWATLRSLVDRGYIQQNPSSPLGNYRITGAGRNYMSMHRLTEMCKHIRRGDEVMQS